MVIESSFKFGSSDSSGFSNYTDDPEVKDLNTLEDVWRLFNEKTFWLLFSLILGITWVIYITFYSPRIFGLIATKIINKFIKKGQMIIGSVSFSVLSGKIMFREVVYLTEDSSYRVQDGWIIFRWWRAYVPKDISEDLSHSDTRLSILLNGFEYHCYNRSSVYSRLERLFGLDFLIFSSENEEIVNEAKNPHPKPPSAVGYSWRDLIPLIKLELCTGRVVYGNNLLPYTLAIVVEEAHMIYTTKPAASKYDHFMHIIKCKAENFKIMLCSSPKYTGLKDDAPRLMGEGFGLVMANKIDFYYYMDEPGVVPKEPEMLLLANGDQVEANPPIWGIDIKCGKGTDFSYGPWADRQREALYKLFFPQDYESLKPTPAPVPGDSRSVRSFDIRLSTLSDATIDILFTKDEETNAVHMNVGPGSYLEVTLPWLVQSNGYSTKITGQLLHLEASTSLQFRDLVSCETLQFDIVSSYPLVWNEHQEWVISLTCSKATAYLIYAHKWFFQAMINDWSSRTPPDILKFVPFTYCIDFCLKEFEIITTTNEYNWIDCSSQNKENNLIGASGELFQLSFSLPFHEFLPTTVLFKFWIQIEMGSLFFHVPEVSTSFSMLQSLLHNGKIIERNGKIRSLREVKDEKTKKWNNVILEKDGWIECWNVPLLAVSVKFIYHPLPPVGPTPQADITTPEKEELLLFPIRMPEEKNNCFQGVDKGVKTCEFDPISLLPDRVSVEVEVGPSDILLYGSLLALLINLKENVFGDFQNFTDMESVRSGSGGSGEKETVTISKELVKENGEFDPRVYRPLDVSVSVILHDIRAHLLKNCAESEPPCPYLSVERFGFEMDKKYDETVLQVLLSPLMLSITDNVLRAKGKDEHLRDGFLMLSSLQIRGDGMFSNEGRSLDEETLEYAWLLEILAGTLCGRLSAPQLETLLSSLSIFISLALGDENRWRSPLTTAPCHHGHFTTECPLFMELLGREGEMCPGSEGVKYKMVRGSVDKIDVTLSEVGTALNLWISPIRFSTCNLHGKVMEEGFTLLIPTVQLRHFVMVNSSFTQQFQFSDANNVSSSETMTASWSSNPDKKCSVPQSPVSESALSTFPHLWLEAGSVSFGPLTVEIGSQGSSQKFKLQNDFLLLHDRKTKRLWFLWKLDNSSSKENVQKCGCVGGCKFFSTNTKRYEHFFEKSKDEWLNDRNVASFRVNKMGEGYGFGQSILKPFVLMFDTPPYTTGPNSLLLLHSDIRQTKNLNQSYSKEPLTFKPSLFADLSNTTSSSAHSTLSDKLGSNFGSTLQSIKSKLTFEESPVLGDERSSYVSPHDDLFTSPNLDKSEESEYEGEISEDESGSKVTLMSNNRYLSAGSGPSVTTQGGQNDITIGEHNKDWERGSINSGDSLSDVSFMSAMSAQEECMVNLQMHLNKPIAESSLLMPCYMSHLTQFKCDNWDVGAPKSVGESIGFAPNSSSSVLVYSASKYTPHFTRLVDGFTTLAMVKTGPSSTDNHGKNNEKILLSDVEKRSQNEEEGDVEVTTLIVRFQENINVMISPMLLEAAQKFIEALTPILSKTHPQTVVSSLHSACIRKVVSSNLLKKSKSLLLTRLQNTKKTASGPKTEEFSPSPTNLLEEIFKTELRASISLPTINLTLIQGSVVEERISFSALDNIRDLMCVSLLATSVEGTRVYFCAKEERKRGVQVLYRPTIGPKTVKKGKSKVSPSESLTAEPIFIESSERQAQLISGSINISRIHAQLRRLKNDSSILQHAVITAIPNQHSKVLFRFAKIETHENSRTSEKRGSFCSSQSASSEEGRSRTNSLSDKNDPEEIVKNEKKGESKKKCPDEKLGFIMCECGLEGIEIKGVQTAEILLKGDKKNETEDLINVYNEGKVQIISETEVSYKNENISPKQDSSNEPNKAESEIGDKGSLKDGKEKSLKNEEKKPPSVSCVIQFSSMWYNFAAPPQTPITRKIDYTRVDWNLVSTASTAINAWLNPIDQLTLKIRSMIKASSKRNTGLIASLMAEALEVNTIHQPPKSKYNKLMLTPLAKTLQEDPSCQLCIVLERFMNGVGVGVVEENVSETILPQLSTLRQGVIVLIRQWKNVLYTPLLLEHNFNSKKTKNYNVTFTLPTSDEESPVSDDGELSGEDTENEQATLLRVETNSLKPKSLNSRPESSLSSLSDISDSHKSTVIGQNASDCFSMSSKVINLNPFPIFTSSQNKAKKSKNSSAGSIVTGNWSQNSSLEELGNNTTPYYGNFEYGSSTNNFIPKEASNFENINSYKQDNFNIDPFQPNNIKSHEESLLLGAHTKFPQHPSLMLLDAHVIFKPLLTSLSLMPQQIIGYNFETLGSHMSIRASIETLKIDIVESEGKKGSKHSPSSASKTSDSPAFLSQRIHLEGEFKKSSDLSPDSLLNRTLFSISRAYWRKQVRRDCLFSLSILFISQQVNMPLLRLLHQISTMVTNVRETQLELREQRPINVVERGRNSSSSSNSNRAEFEKKIREAADGRTTLVPDGRTTQAADGRATLVPDGRTNIASDGRVNKDSSSDGRANKDAASDERVNKESASDGRLAKDARSEGRIGKNTEGHMNMGKASEGRFAKGETLEERIKSKIEASGGRFGKNTTLERRMDQKETFGRVSNDKVSTPYGGLGKEEKGHVESGNEVSYGTLTKEEMSYSASGKEESSESTKVQRAQSFAQRLKNVKAPKALFEGVLRTTTPSQTPTSTHAPKLTAKEEDEQLNKTKNTQGSLEGGNKKCWKTIKILLDLYSARPVTKTVLNTRTESTLIKEKLNDSRDVCDDMEKGLLSHQNSTVGAGLVPATSSIERSEKPRFTIFGVGRIERTRLLASLSGLKLEAEILNLQGTGSYAKKLRPVGTDLSLTGHVGESNIVLVEGTPPTQQTVVKISICNSGLLYSSISRRSKDKNSALLTIGPVNVDIPQHPVVLHGMMTRSSKQLSNTLQEFRVNRTSSRISRGTTFDEADFTTHIPQRMPLYRIEKNKKPQSNPTTLHPFFMHFTLISESVSITAALLPSLQAQYKMEGVKSCGVIGSKAKFKIHLPTHSLSFTTKLTISGANLPSAASIPLPYIDVCAEYVQDAKGFEDGNLKGIQLRAGSYLQTTALIGSFEHCLTTDLLNHLLFVQKVFMREVNEVVYKMSGGDKPVPLWDEDGISSYRTLLFTLNVKLKGIQITATTPTNTAVRLETEALNFYMSNRVEGVHVLSSSFKTPPHPPHPSSLTFSKLYLKADVDINLSLGQLVHNEVFEEAESEYTSYAFFKTHFKLQNDMSGEGEKEIVLITLTRPLIYIQPIAVDKAILVWLNYRNAYEYWNKQRSCLNTEVLVTLPPSDRTNQTNAHAHEIHSESNSFLFLQLTVSDMGISIPLNPGQHGWGGRLESENRGAVIVTLESSSISACSYASLVSKGKFTNLCFRFTDDMVSMDDWKPNLNDPSVFNYCSVSEGTYEVCSRTTSQLNSSENAKWFLNVQWSMEGVDMHIDVNIGKQLSALGHTLTTLAAFEEDDDDDEILERDSALTPQDSDNEILDSQTSTRTGVRKSKMYESSSVEYENNMSNKRNLLEKQMQEHVSQIEELIKCSAPEHEIENERKKLQELESVAFKDFRRDWIKKLRRQSSKSGGIKDKFGLGSSNKPITMRSQSFAAHSQPLSNTPATQSPEQSPIIPLADSFIKSRVSEGTSFLSSLRFGKSKQKVTFGETMRQYSVDSAKTVSEDHDDDILNSAWIEEDNETFEKDKNEEGCGGGELTPGSSISQKAVEPNVDLELDVKVFINSGKCALHTKVKGESEVGKKSKKETTHSSNLLHVTSASPLSSRKLRSNPSASKLKGSPFGNGGGLDVVTIFHIPGLDVKIHYNSHILYEEREGFSGRKGGTKKASLFAWTILHSVPEETIISPHILDFLEQTLEPIPLTPNQKSFDGASIGTDAESGVASTYYSSFPVDVIVYFHMKPSTFRFSCQPVSRVECMLRLPSLDIVFSSKRAEEKKEELREVNISQSKSKSKLQSDLSFKEKENQQLAIGGLSVSGCLSDFSLYIFHPYGAAKKSTADWSPLSDNERKDSVSMNVEFIKFNLSRSRKIYYKMATSSSYDSKNSYLNNDQQLASIRFSIIVDIGSASFKYDMRRLTEILAFPKAWYRRSIVRRLFLGDLSNKAQMKSNMSYGSSEDQSSESGKNSPLHFDDAKIDERRLSGTLLNKSHQKDKLKLNLETNNGDQREPIKRRGSKLDFFSGPKTPKGKEDDPLANFEGGTDWETLVLFTVNFTKLNVQMNMGNVMGNVSWMIRDARGDGKLSIGSRGHENLHIGVGVGSSYIEAKGGIVGGTFEIVQLSSFVSGKEDPGTEPHHTVGLKLGVLELKLDFMGTSVLMGRGSSLEIRFKDEWKVLEGRSGDVPMATYRPAMIFIHGDLNWDQLQLMISKSTTVDLLKMQSKLEEFFSQQFKSSKWVFSTLQTDERSPNSSFAKINRRKEQDFSELKSECYWHEVLRKVSHLAISSLLNPLPASGTVLGGTMDLHGNNISLACFHGMNFKAKSWALFSLKEPFISFQTEAQETHAPESSGVHVVQNLNVSLGQSNIGSGLSSHESMAVVSKVTRHVIFSPQFRTLQEWFHYAFAPSKIDDVERFPSMEREKTEGSSTNSVERRTRLLDPNHNHEVIFALPTLELFFKTEHLQEVSKLHSRPLVDCSFITEFGDHIFVTVDAEAFFFLHDLITSYIKEKEKLVSAQIAAGRSHSPNISYTNRDESANNSNKSGFSTNAGSPDSTYFDTSSSSTEHLSLPHQSQQNLNEDESGLVRDSRNYHCKTWQLEPTVRLLSWAGKSIEPYGVDYILHKLGFSHARTTIPKWMQRGFMDPLDKVLSILVYRMIDLAQRENNSDEKGRTKK